MIWWCCCCEWKLRCSKLPQKQNRLKGKPSITSCIIVMDCTYTDLGQVYAEMLTVCQPFYALPPSTSKSKGITPQPSKPFFLHPRLEDGLLSCSTRPVCCSDCFANPQDAACEMTDEDMNGMVHAQRSSHAQVLAPSRCQIYHFPNNSQLQVRSSNHVSSLQSSRSSWFQKKQYTRWRRRDPCSSL
jgi:hypothetical protein